MSLWHASLIVCVAGLLYPFFLYPLILRIAVAWQSRSDRSNPNVAGREPIRLFTVIIPAHNEELVIGAKLANTLKAARATGLPYEIVVASDCSDDHTCEIAKSYPEAKVLDIRQRGGILGAFRAGLAASDGEVVIFSDADITVGEGTLRAMLRPFEGDPTVGGVCGCTLMRVQDASGLDVEQLNVAARSWTRYRQSQLDRLIGADGSNWAVRRKLIAFPAVPVIADDLVIPLEILRQGYQFTYEPSAIAYEVSPASVAQEFRRKVRTIAGGIEAGWRCQWMFTRRYWSIGFHYLSWKLMKYMVGVWVILACAASAGLALEGSRLGQVLIGVGVVGLGVVGMAGALHSRVRGRAGKTLSAIWYLASISIAPILAIVYLVRNHQSATWTMTPRAPVSGKEG